MPLENKNPMFPTSQREPEPKQHPQNSHTSNPARGRSQSRDQRVIRNSQPNNKEPLRPQTANSRNLESMKLAVPNTIPTKIPDLKHMASNSTLNEQENMNMRNLVKQEVVPRQQGRLFQMHGQNNDDSTEITTGEAGWDDDGQGYSGEPTAILRPTQKPMPREDMMRGFALPSNWQEVADGERIRTGAAPVHSNGTPLCRQGIRSHDNDDTLDLSDDEEDDYIRDVQTLSRGTPSRATNRPSVPIRGQQEVKSQGSKQARIAQRNSRTPIIPRREKSSSPLPGQEETAGMTLPQQQNHVQQSSLARHSNYKQQLPLSIEQLEPARPDVNYNLQPSKVSAYHEPSEEEQIPLPEPQLAEGAFKRTHAEIDYDYEDLKTKAFADIDQVAFLTDPRAFEVPQAVDSNGTPMSLPQRLSNLKKMKADDQAALFQSMTDNENEEVGQWFVTQFQDNLKKLMERRLERRKIALKYELEARKRETEVHVKNGDLDEEFKQLRKGGGELIKDKSVASLGGTPRKE